MADAGFLVAGLEVGVQHGRGGLKGAGLHAGLILGQGAEGVLHGVLSVVDHGGGVVPFLDPRDDRVKAPPGLLGGGVAQGGVGMNYLEKQTPTPEAAPAFPRQFNLNLKTAQELRYGENPHQNAKLFGDFHSFFNQLQGKELSFNNILDITGATNLIAEFDRPTVGILKHTNPCGIATAGTLAEAWDQAFETDKQAPFGGIIVANREVDKDLAERIAHIFSEVIIAPSFSAEAREIFAKKKNLRLMEQVKPISADKLYDVRYAIGGVLVQERDIKAIDPSVYKVVTERQPTEEELRAMLFGWKVVKHVKSNAIVYAGCERTLGIGAGQMSRVDSSRIAVWKAGEAGLSLKGSVIASDAFFPFADGLLAAADAGATAAIQPGGSVRDQEVIDAANARGMAMIFTGHRHFRH